MYVNRTRGAGRVLILADSALTAFISRAGLEISIAFLVDLIHPNFR